LIPAVSKFDFKNHKPLILKDVKGGKGVFIFRFDQFEKEKVFVNDEKLENLYFEILFKICAKFNLIKSGEFILYQDEKFILLLDRIFKNKRYHRKIYIPSGANKFTLLKILNNSPKLFGQDVKFDDFEEGDLFPDTYHYFYGETKSHLIRIMKKRTFEILDKLWNEKDSSLPYKNQKEALTLASIVEKEAFLNEDKALIASVFINRLKLGMKLQADPTFQYANKLRNYQRESQGLEKEKFNLMIDSPYNTYYAFGLPPGPISNVSYSTLYSVFHPALTDFLYFISFPGEKKFYFSKTYKEHNEHVINLRKKQKELKKIL
jgi:UPF0755 protein